eukprot:scaffold4698_cov332-Prasinococcus_capsulatus_cf.AAC.2
MADQPPGCDWQQRYFARAHCRSAPAARRVSALSYSAARPRCPTRIRTARSPSSSTALSSDGPVGASPGEDPGGRGVRAIDSSPSLEGDDAARGPQAGPARTSLALLMASEV